MIRNLIALLRINRYKLYTKPYELNIVSIRSAETVSNKFDDLMYVFFKDERGDWKIYRFRITTDPGTYWLNHPMQVEGTAILKQGQYENAYRIGLHRGQYKALVQSRPVTVIRDYDRNAVLDFFNGRETTGNYGINIHRASLVGSTKKVDKWSAGCQVFERVADFQLFMQLCERHSQLNGNRFTYTLFDARMLKRLMRRKIAYTITGTLAIGCITYLLYTHYN